MPSHFLVTTDVTPNKTQNERLKVAFSSMFLQCKKSQRFGDSFFPKFHHTRRKIPLPTLGRSYSEQKSLCNRSQFRTLSLPTDLSRFVLFHQRPVSIEFLTICRIPEFPKSEQIQKSCGNVRIWWKRADVLRKDHNNLNKSFGMNIMAEK